VSYPADPALRALGLWSAGFFSGPEGQLDAADEYFNESLTIALTIGNKRVEAMVLNFRVRNLIFRGDYAAATAEGEHALTTSRELGSQFELCRLLILYGMALALSADHVRANACVTEAIDVSRESGDVLNLTNALIARALICVEADDSDGARKALDEAQQLSETHHYHAQIATGHWLRARLARAQHDLETARAHSVKAATNASTYRLNVSSLFETLAEVTAATGEHRQAARILGFSAALHAAAGISLWAFAPSRRERLEAEVRSALGETVYTAEYAAGREMPAEAILAEEAATYAARRANLPPQPVSGSTSDLLTPRELDVLQLLVEGHTNREIAETLFITQRTAATHVTNILTKLNLESRTAAAAWAVREGIVW
jgi:non-specific serine/threonine protein kinase